MGTLFISVPFLCSAGRREEKGFFLYFSLLSLTHQYGVCYNKSPTIGPIQIFDVKNDWHGCPVGIIDKAKTFYAKENKRGNTELVFLQDYIKGYFNKKTGGIEAPTKKLNM